MSVTNTQVHEMRANGEAMAKKLNDLFEKNNLKDLIDAKKVAIAYHSSVMNGELGQEYKDGYLAWVKGGAAVDLVRKFDKKDNTTKFHAGSFGSVWFDTELTGGHGVQKRTKTVRVTPIENYQNGQILIILDATFDDKW